MIERLVYELFGWPGVIALGGLGFAMLVTLLRSVRRID